jgi:predicted nuclease with RNAse H fold
MNCVGIDVGATRLHVVAIDSQGCVEFGSVVSSNDFERLIDLCRGASCVAVDAPDRLSTAPHADDADVGGRPLSNKFRRARCAEIGLGTQSGVWVPWATPEHDPPHWMAVGLRLFRDLRAAEVVAIEVYPYAGFRALASGGRLAKKTDAAGIAARVDLLRNAGIDDRWLSLWSHDSLDATVAAVVARDYVAGRAVSMTCGHDGSAIWLPAPL